MDGYFATTMIAVLQRTPYAGALLTGLLMGIAFPPGFLGAVAWIGLVPLLIRLSAELGWRDAVLESLLASTITTVIVGHWTLFHPMASAQAASLAGLLTLSIIAAMPFCLFGLPAKRASLAFRFGLLFGSSATIEYAQFHTEIGFPWLALGHTQATLFPINQLAAYVGTPGLSTCVLVTNALIVSVILGKPRRGKAAPAALAAFLAVSLILGFARSGTHQEIIGMHRVLAVQPALSADAWSDVRDQRRPLHLIELTRTGLEEPIDLIIWPETSLPVLEAGDEPRSSFPELASFVDSAGVPLLTGAIIEEVAGGTRKTVYHNSAVVWNPFVGITGRYDKRIPVPFAERVPYVDRYPWLERLALQAGGVSGYGAGTRPSILEIDGVRVGVMICFESAFGRAARVGSLEMPAYLVVLAQDGWWGNSAGYQQHFAITRLRAIETGRAVVQVTVTGTTGMILQDGSSVDETEWMDRTVQAYEVPVYRGTTPYTRFGDLPVLLFGLLLLLSGWSVKTLQPSVHPA